MPASGSVADDLVVYVGNVHHVADRSSGQPQEAAENVDLQKCTEVADVAVVVDRGPAGVHAQRLAVGSGERIQLSREGIEKAEGHRLSFVPIWLMSRPARSLRPVQFALSAAYSILAAQLRGERLHRLDRQCSTLRWHQQLDESLRDLKPLAARGSKYKRAGPATTIAVRPMRQECGQSRASSVYFDPQSPPSVFADADLSDN